MKQVATPVSSDRNSVIVKSTNQHTMTFDAGSSSDSSPPQTRVISTIPRMHASSLSDTQNRQDGDVIGDIHRRWYGGHGSCSSWTWTFQYSTSALGLRRCHQGSAACIKGMRATSDEDKADSWRHTMWITTATTSRNGKIEPRTASMTSDCLSNEQASEWCDSSSQCTRLYSIGRRRRRQMTNCSRRLIVGLYVPLFCLNQLA